ncbi:MAG TPA: BTAD domain-containing putative transcriptional regulator, partial [Candidatus Baltobacteraceae bacterium]|nr:BTAD domain-containing putative transcriptional regulator [Candidatus Baltobacteraceae bacterium]
MTTLRLFGHPALEHKGARRPANLPPKAIAAVALIIANAPRPLSRDRIAQALWPGIDPPQARANLRRQLYVAAKTLGRDALLIDRETVQWNPSCALQVDALHFDAHHASDPESAAQQYLGELCEGVDDPALDEIRAGYARRYESLLAQATARARESGDRDALARCLQRALQQDPLDEEIARELMRLRCASGDRASALRIYNQLSRDLQRELGTLPSEDTGAALDQVLSADASSAIRTNIVAPQTSLVAREQEVETVHALLTQHCLVSIIGPGGIGKTRLAIAAALSAAQLYPDGVWFVELAGVKERHAILERMSAAAGARCGSGEPEEALTEALHRKRVLLVIDNCEHVRSDVSKICGVLADRTAARMLVTSRSKLAAEFEAAYDLGGLAIPPLQMRSADAVRRYGAVRLFMERVCAVAPHVRLNDANAQVIAEIVSRLDGIPLAIELIAARGGMLTLEALHKRITSNLSIVTRAGAARGATERHATMERALRWSYELLGTAEQALFRRLYVFAGPWDADACHVVCVEGSSTLNDISNLLSQLADASLLRRRIVNDTVHYTMLQPIRQFSESLGADERETLIRKHAEYYIAFAGRHDAPMETHGDDYLRAMVGAEENLLFALRTA